MSQLALTNQGAPVDASTYSPDDWELLKSRSLLGDFVMPCCKAPAVLKTSPNGLAFFAHSSDQCDTAPETIWHRTGKAAVVAAIQSLGVDAREEVPGKSPNGSKWQADVLFEIGKRKIAIELQRSYQHHRDYMRRQDRYMQSGVECHWLTRRETFVTLVGTTSRILIKRDYGGKFPEGGVGTGLLNEYSVAMLELDDSPVVNMGGGNTSSLSAWITGIISHQYQYRGGAWNLS